MCQYLRAHYVEVTAGTHTNNISNMATTNQMKEPTIRYLDVEGSVIGTCPRCKQQGTVGKFCFQCNNDEGMMIGTCLPTARSVAQLATCAWIAEMLNSKMRYQRESVPCVVVKICMVHPALDVRTKACCMSSYGDVVPVNPEPEEEPEVSIIFSNFNKWMESFVATLLGEILFNEC